MTKDDLHFRLRIPADLKAKVEEASEANRRSMTAEIIARLTASFDNDTPENEMADVRKTHAELRNVAEQLKEERDKFKIQRAQTLQWVAAAIDATLKNRPAPPMPDLD